MILVIGAAGHIGNVLVRELTSRGENVKALVLPGEDCRPLADSNTEIVEANILDYPALIKAIDGVDVVFHLASLVALVPEQFEIMRKVNIEGTANVIRACFENNVKRLVYTSSIHAYGHPEKGLVIDESLPFDTVDRGGSYDQTKAKASELVAKAAKDGLNAVILAPTGVIGPYDFKRSEMGEMTYYWMNSYPTFTLDGAYDFVDVRDVVAAHIKAIELGKPGEAYILPGHRITVRDYRRLVQEASGKRAPEVYIPTKFARLFAPMVERVYRVTKTRPRFTRYSLDTLMSNSVISRDKAVRELDFHVRPMIETVTDTVWWWQENVRMLKPTLRHASPAG